MKTLDSDLVEEQIFVLRSYRKQELAMLYFPDADKQSATRSMRRWILQCTNLNQQLMAVTGYNPKRKFYSRREVELIVEYLGLP